MPHKQPERDAIAESTARYLAKGGKIQHVPTKTVESERTGPYGTAEARMIRDMHGNGTMPADIAAVLNRSPDSVRMKMVRMGLLESARIGDRGLLNFHHAL